ncbi:low temperature requirement protein A [Streptomyces sp. NPDC006872]|uniref:low temperature requirement protein A n=1 Tax=Streptomyces sp. NPDC006872 TaxID=3155720 RepID=UPI0033F3958C
MESEQYGPPQSGPPAGARKASASSRVTTFELFFDLVYVFTLTQITQYMAHHHTGTGVLHGVLLLALCLLLAGIPAAAALPPVAALAGVVVILAAVAAAETRWYGELRRHVGR